MKRLLALLALVLAVGCTPSGQPTPLDAPPVTSDLRLNPLVTQAPRFYEAPPWAEPNVDTWRQTICTPGWTDKVRPPTSYTTPIELALLDKLPPEADHDPTHYELDHWVPLAVGGAPRARANLVLQLRVKYGGDAEAKDTVESRVHRRVCAGVLTLAEGRACFTVDWTRC